MVPAQRKVAKLLQYKRSASREAAFHAGLVPAFLLTPPCVTGSGNSGGGYEFGLMHHDWRGAVAIEAAEE